MILFELLQLQLLALAEEVLEGSLLSYVLAVATEAKVIHFH